MNTWGTLLAAAALALTAGCGGANDDPFSVDVDWHNYASDVRDRIDNDRRAADCAGLSAAHQRAADNNTAQRNRVGDGNRDLMEYIDASMRAAGCID